MPDLVLDAPPRSGLAGLHRATVITLDHGLAARPKAPRVEVRRGKPLAQGGARPELEQLACEVLALAFGVSSREPYPRRCHASSGNLHTTEARVLLPGGPVARFAAESGALECWSERAARGPLPGETLVVSLAVVLERQTAKYGLRGVRYALLDLGHALGALLLAARALGLSWALLDWDDDATRASFALGGARPVELPGLVIALGRDATTLASVPAEHAVAHEDALLTAADARPQRFYASTRGERGAVLPRDFGGAWPLPHDWTSRGPAWIRQRRSARSFDRRACPPAAQAAILTALRAGIRGAGVSLAFGVIGHEGDEDLRVETGFLCACQVVAEEAAFVVLIGAPRAELFAEGSPTYRAASIAVGALSQLLCVTAETVGLRANPLGAYLDDEAAEHLEPDHVVLLAIAFGSVT